jgi:signal transduction histidine kinase
MLRTCLLAELGAAGSDVDSAGILRMMRAVERVQRIIENDDAHRFRARLAGPGGLELLVEVGHDLRSPLASILFLAETLRKAQSGEVNAVQERQLGLIYSAAFGLSTVASDVIAFARGGDRLIDPKPEAFSVLAILRSVQDIVLPLAEEKGLTVKLTPPDADFRVGHPGALNRVLLNLTTNALKFTSSGFVEISVKSTSRSRLEFSVRDTGRGIPADVMSSLFDPFRRRNPGDYTFSSAGLGLSICRRLVSAMGGTLGVETSDTNGTRFFFELELPVVTRL